MTPPLFAGKKISVMFNLIMVVLLAGCVTTPSVGQNGPPSGVVEMDQNTDPRFFIRNQLGAIGFLKTAGNEVRLNGRQVVKDTYIQNGAHVSTGLESGAIITFFVREESDCGLEVRDFRRGRLFGVAERCGHIVVTDQGVMETRGWPASYHVEIPGAGVTVFTAINGQTSVWLHSNPSYVVVVPSYHQVSLSHDWISVPRRVTPGEVESITRWRRNFDEKPPAAVIVPGLLEYLLNNIRFGVSVPPSNGNRQPKEEGRQPEGDLKPKGNIQHRVSPERPPEPK